MVDAADFAARVRTNQEGLLGNLKSSYDFIVCGSGSSGSVVARRLAEIPDASVLLIEAGGSDDVPAVQDAARWRENLGRGRDWAFPARAKPHLNRRTLMGSLGKGLSVFRSYIYPWIDRSNLTVLTGTLVTKVLFDGRRATGVEVIRDGKVEHVRAGSEVVLSLGAIQTPKILMQSGIGDAKQLRSFGIGVVQHLPGVGANLQEHVLLGGCVWEYALPDQFRGSCGEATFFAKSDPALATPDLQAFINDGSVLSPELSSHAPTSPAWSIG